MTDLTQLRPGAPQMGDIVPNWRPPAAPGHTPHDGAWMRLEPLNANAHAEALFNAYAEDTTGAVWDYLPYGPFATVDDFHAWATASEHASDPLFFTVCPQGGPPAGVLSYLRITQEHGAIEIGHLNFAPRLQRTPAATEAVFTLIDHAFTLGYRRVEWKCNALNLASRRAALRFGMSFEGVFRQMMVIKGRNRDSAWFSVLDHEWAPRAERFRRWLAPENFDADGRQRSSLRALMDELSD